MLFIGHDSAKKYSNNVVFMSIKELDQINRQRLENAQENIANADIVADIHRVVENVQQ